MSKLEQLWESKREDFIELTKDEFDSHFPDGFSAGPLKAESSNWFKEFGPYTPQQWAFGKLENGRLVCTQTQSANAR